MNKTYSLIPDNCSCNSPEFKALLNKYEEVGATVDLHLNNPDVYQELINTALRGLKTKSVNSYLNKIPKFLTEGYKKKPEQYAPAICVGR